MADSAQVEQLQAEGREAAQFIRNMLVQAPTKERGNYGERSSSKSAGRAHGGGRLFMARDGRTSRHCLGFRPCT